MSSPIPQFSPIAVASSTKSSMPIIATVILLVGIITLSLSTYGLGREENNKQGPAYQAASAFTMMSVSVIIVAIFIMLFTSGK